LSRLGIVVIGRNEGERLRRSLESVLDRGPAVVYVDSGSRDGSPDLARQLGATVVELDGSAPFTAGRGRNAGFERLLALQPDLELVQFVDGDCEVVPGWLGEGQREIEADPRVAILCGRVRERHPERSVYNRLCDLEWDAPPGEARACGGNALVRVEAFRASGGFRSGLIAGEEPELCLRLRHAGWRILRSARDMVLHDADMTRFGQWWRRALRAGWAYAEGAALHGSSPERHWVRDARSILFWGLLLPVAALLLAWPTRGLALALLAGYPVLAARIYAWGIRRGLSRSDAALQAGFIVLGKFPQAIGLVQFASMRLLRRRRRVVDWRVAG
jgi:GT2 family glycosyltransferase